jgi:EAL domain-containing protein (putative c-di-GMP-specific phosphodiesterase class I)/FixJ family two-component response regulator
LARAHPHFAFVNSLLKAYPNIPDFVTVAGKQRYLMDPDLSDASTVQPEPASGADSAARVVLVCDDDLSVTHFVAKVSGRLGVTCHEANSAEAIQALALAHPSALMFLDLSLGHGDAIEVLKFLRDHAFAGTIALISGHENAILDNVVAIGRRHGLTMLPPIRKPVTTQALRAVLYREGLAAAPREPKAARAGDRLLAQAVQAASAPSQPSIMHETDHAGDVLRGGRLELSYRPIVGLSDYRATGIETRALVVGGDGRAEDLAAVMNTFSEDETALLTRGLVAKALADWEKLAGQGVNLRFSLAVPTREVLSGRFCEAIRKYWTADPRWPGLLIEIQEDCLDACFETLRDELIRLRLYKVDFAVSDLGRVSRWFRSYRRLRVGELQLNPDFVHGCAEDSFKAEICRASVELGRKLGATVTAKGIDDQADLAMVRLQGFAQGQGDLLAPAVQLDRLVPLLQSGAPLVQPGGAERPPRG